MSTQKNAPRLLGAAFLVVVLTSLSGGVLLSSSVGSGGISDVLVNIANRGTLMRTSILADLLTSLGVIVLAVLLYIVLNNQNRIVALVGFGCWLAEAMALAFSKIGALALIPLSAEFVRAGAPANSYYQTLGEFLYNGVVQQLGSTTHMFFYCSGGILWYYLLYKSNYVPRAISLFGLAAVVIALGGIVLEFLGYSVSIFVFLPLLPFELAIGFWLLVKGINAGAEPDAVFPGTSTAMPVKPTVA
ncbi:MAG: DUF4386 domain-containing protein [Candidatus Dormibacterales bacterium]